MSLSQVFLLFVIYSCIGWISEMIYCAVLDRRLVNRGFLHGPLCPVYGFGALFVVFLLSPFESSVFLLFFLGMALATLVEYGTAWMLETAFSTRWWDYSSRPFNLHGRICLRNSVLFGLMALVSVKVIHPFLVILLVSIPHLVTDSLAAFLGILLFLDIAFTLKSLVSFGEKLASLAVFMESVSEKRVLRERFVGKDLWEILRDIKVLVERENTVFNRQLAHRLESLLSGARGMRRLLRAFPSVRSMSHASELRLFRLFHGSLPDEKLFSEGNRLAHLLVIVAVVGLVAVLALFVFR